MQDCEAANLKNYDICTYEQYLGEFIDTLKIPD